MARIVLALFEKLEEAEAAVDDLVQSGFNHDTIRIDPNEHGDGLILTVSTEDQPAERASEILNKHHPVDLSLEGRTWQGFNEETRESFFTADRSAYREREPRPELDYGPGAVSMPGKAIEDYDRKNIIPQENAGAAKESWKTYESRFRAHFEGHYERPGKEWSNYRDAYRFGFETAQDPQYSNTTWERSNAYIQERWNSRMMGKNWEAFMEAVHDGWKAGRASGS